MIGHIAKIVFFVCVGVSVAALIAAIIIEKLVQRREERDRRITAQQLARFNMVEFKGVKESRDQWLI